MLTQLPSVEHAYEHENAFYLTCAPGRVGKLLAHYELYQRAQRVAGAFVECGIFKGASLARFAMFRHLFESEETRALIGFDVFGKFPETAFDADKDRRARFISAAGDESISVDQLRKVLADKGCDKNVTLVVGDICQTVPTYVAEHPELRIALLHVDVDILEPTRVVMETLAPLVVPGGVIVLDDYGIFPGATRAVDEFMKGRPERIQKLPYALAPSFVIHA
jgi:macrocin-O-methyltransferase TylF-like protien